VQIKGCSDEQFLRELQVASFIAQIAGYPVGHPKRGLDFQPIVQVAGNREATLALFPAAQFTDEDRAILLSTGPNIP
jgi:hypothetical protein